MDKVYIDVIAEFGQDGSLRPLSFIWEDGKRYSVDRVLRIERCASRKAGGVGTMYTCRVEGKESHLFLEEDRWFVARR